MPKERTHLLIAAKVQRGLPRGSLLRPVLGRYPNLYRTGSVVPDTPAYYAWGRKRRKLHRRFRDFHREMNRRGFPVEGLVRSFTGGSRDGPVMALLAGVITHVVADRTFHPVINFFCGRDLGRHYLLESYLDLYLGAGLDKKNQPDLRDLLSGLEVAPGFFVRMVGALFGLQEEDDREIRRAWDRHVRIQGRFSRPRLLIPLKTANIFLLFRLRPLISLWYPPVRHPSRLFARPAAYPHPVTGERTPLDWRKLKRKAIATAVRVLGEMEKRMNNRSRLLAYFSSGQAAGLLPEAEGKSPSFLPGLKTRWDIRELAENK